MSTVAIVILNWNGRNYLEEFLPSVLQYSSREAEIIVADNGSADDSVAWLQRYHPAIRLIRLPVNLGFAGGYNAALQEVEADYFVLLNSDVRVTASWITPVIELMERNPLVAACQPKLLDERRPGFFEYAGASGGWIDALGYPFARGRVFDAIEADEGQYDDTVSVFWASGAAMFVRSTAWRTCGGLDDYFFAHMEEIDFCWRLQRGGYLIMACPQSVVYHVGGGTLPKGSRKTYLNFRNNLIMLCKNLPAEELIWKIPVRMALDALAAWRGLLGGSITFFLAVAKAHGGFLIWYWLRKKGEMVPRTQEPALHGWLNSSLVWAYFARRKRKFQEIIDRNTV